MMFIADLVNFAYGEKKYSKRAGFKWDPIYLLTLQEGI